jgi:hypothetical protein
MDRIGLVLKFDMVSMRIEKEKVARYDTFDMIRIKCIEASRTPDPDPYPECVVHVLYSLLGL